MLSLSCGAYAVCRAGLFGLPILWADIQGERISAGRIFALAGLSSCGIQRQQ